VQLRCVLSIDDEEDIQSIIRISLERIGGITAHFCNDPREAMAKAREVRPDLILLDFLMPALDGATLFKRLKPTGPRADSRGVPVRGHDGSRCQAPEFARRRSGARQAVRRAGSAAPAFGDLDALKSA